jgi:hypothetical protein
LEGMTSNLENAPISAGGAGQIPKIQSVFAIDTHPPSGHAGGAGQIPRATAINVGSHPVPPTRIHTHSGHAGGTAQFPQAHPINDNTRLLLEGMTRNMENAPISA